MANLENSPELEEIDELFIDVTEAPSESVETVNGTAPEIELIPEMPFVAETLGLRAFIIRNPQVFQMTKLRKLFVDAFPGGPLHPNAIDVIEWCAGVCEQKGVAIILAIEGDPQTGEYECRGLVIAEFVPTDPWSLGPHVLYFYSTGTRIVKVLTKSLDEWLESIGQTHCYGFNRTGASDEGYARFLSHQFEVEKRSTLFEISRKE